MLQVPRPSEQDIARLTLQTHLQDSHALLREMEAAEEKVAGQATDEEQDDRASLQSYLARKLGLDCSCPGGVELKLAVQLTELPGLCEFPPMTWGEPWLKCEALMPEALRRMLLRVKELLATRPLQFRRLFGGRDGAGGMAPLSDPTIVKYSQDGARLPLMIVRQLRLEDEKLWPGVPLPPSTRPKAAALCEALTRLRDEHPQELVPRKRRSAASLKHLPPAESFKGVEEALLDLLVNVYHRRIDLFAPAFNTPILRFLATALHNADTTMVIARQVGARCAPALQLAKTASVLALQRRADQAQAQAPPTADPEEPLLAKEIMQEETQYLYSDGTDHPPPFECIMDVCRMARYIADGKDEMPRMVWSASDPTYRSIWVQGQLLSLDNNIIPGTRAAIDRYRQLVRSVIGPDIFDRLYEAQMSDRADTRPIRDDEWRKRTELYGFTSDMQGRARYKEAFDMTSSRILDQCTPLGIDVSTLFNNVLTHRWPFNLIEPLCMAKGKRAPCHWRTKEFEDKMDEISDLRYFLSQVVGGQPARTTETAKMKLANHKGVRRDIFLVESNVTIVSEYGKADAAVQAPRRLVARFLDQETSAICAIELALLRHVYVFLSERLHNLERQEQPGEGQAQPGESHDEPFRCDRHMLFLRYV